MTEVVARFQPLQIFDERSISVPKSLTVEALKKSSIQLTRQEKRELLEAMASCKSKKSKRWREMRDRLFAAHYGLVIWCVERHSAWYVDFDDLLQVGCMSLMRSLETYVVGISQFSTYAVHGMIQNIQKEKDRAWSIIRTRYKDRGLLNTIENAAGRLSHELGREPRDEELASAVGITVSELTDFRKRAVVGSLDFPLSEPDGDTVGDIVSAPEENGHGSREDFRNLLWEILRVCGERHYEVLVRRHGLEGETPESLNSIADDYGVSKERIRQIENQAFGLIAETLLERGFVSRPSDREHLCQQVRRMRGQSRQEKGTMMMEFRSSLKRGRLKR